MKIFYQRMALFVLLIASMSTGSLYSQVCDNNFALVKLKAGGFETPKKIALTNTNEIIVAGDLSDFNEAGHLAKISSSGNLLWSYFYTVNYGSQFYKDFFKHVSFNDIASAADGSFIAAGNVTEFNYKAGAFTDTAALLTKIDKYGNTLWTKIFRSDLFPEIISAVAINAVIQTSGGDIIAYMATDNGYKTFGGTHSYDKVICLDAAGNIKWSTLLFTALFDAGGMGLGYKRCITEGADHNIMIARAIHKTDISQGQFYTLPGNLHFLSLDGTTGKVKWETNYAYPVPETGKLYTPGLLSAKQLPGGNFSIISNLYVQDVSGLKLKPVQIIIDNAGAVRQVFSFNYPDNGSCYAISAADDAGSDAQVLLLDKSGEKHVIKVDGNGRVLLAKGYRNNDATITSTVLAAGSKGLYLYGANNHNQYAEMMLTDPQGNIDCAAYDITVNTGAAALSAPDEEIFTDLGFNYADKFSELGHALKREVYTMEQNSICVQPNPCCHDVIDSTDITPVTICRGKQYMLPDSSVVQDSGLYYVTFKTPLGCDSVRFYNVKADKDVAGLSAGNDTCLTGQLSMVLKATEGFEQYVWMNNEATAENEYRVTAPGTYFVKVTNTCGSKTDSLHVYELCEYSIYMPAAFTPNDDGLNDVFRIPPGNKNRLINFSIYDRWGNLIFKTAHSSIGWDGTYKNEPLSSGSYFYHIQMQGITGKPLSKKGYVVLLR